MELRDILHEVFPGGTICFCRQNSFEIRGLPKNSEPKGCTVLLHRAHKSARPGERRDDYLVRARDVTLLFRICSADPVRGDTEFVEGRDVAYTAEGQEALERRVRTALGRHR